MTEFPAGYVTSLTRHLQSAVVDTVSPFTFAGQIQDWLGERWVLGLDVTVRRGPETRIFEAFANHILNKRRPFVYRDPGIRNTAHATITVDGAGQTGNTLVTAGWTVVGLGLGDFFSLGSGEEVRLYQLTAEVTPVDGAATLQFVPALRSSPADGAEVEIASPGVLLRAASDVPPTLRADRTLLRIDAVEHL